ncbi:phosphoribosyltransferase-like protein [Leucosporidium creatinivorum]|uniref:Phosphoribosyltransferase-like protein n=1 Tax=Leucosporidium creatinivorum TaxID=106004 RepID=A0A1Y2ETX7_9BASI|nr:phosphoribosyltransferase-like protein [Leucosporidium creatinivorum]
MSAAPQLDTQGLEYDGKIRVTYNDMHILIQKTAPRIKAEFNPDLMVAIGGGGFVPARMLRSFLKQGDGEKRRNIPIQAIGLSLYEEVGAFDGTPGLAQEEKLGKEVVRTQWLDLSTLGSKPLIGRRILIVDEVDDSRTTLSYAVAELQKDIDEHLAALTPEQRAATPPTELAIFVVHNKDQPKACSIPSHVRYFAGEDTKPKSWICYPWEQEDILLHDAIALKQKELGL